MECISGESSKAGINDAKSTTNEDGNCPDSWCIVANTTQPRLPLQQLNLPATASPRSLTTVTPYRYHRCQVIPEEAENQENVNPHNKGKLFSTHPGSRSGGVTREVLSDKSPPFAYPLIWESHHVAPSVSPSTHSPSSSTSSFLISSGSISSFESPKSRSRRVWSSSDSSCDVKFAKALHRAKVDVNDDSPSFTKENTVDKVPLPGIRSKRSGYHSEGNTNGSSSRGGQSSSVNVSHPGSSITTPSKSSFTPSPSSGSVFRTPSERFARMGNSHGALTPKQRSTAHHQSVNPFEVGIECLQLPTVSPSLFRQVVSPNQNVDTKFRWSIDQLAVLHPVNIETSPYNQGDLAADPDYELQAQDAIDRYFNQQLVVPSPWTASDKSSKLMPAAYTTPCQLMPSVPATQTNTVWCQTELSLPPVLPDALEEALKPFCTFSQDQWWQCNSEAEEGSNLNNTTLRRKLLFSQDELQNATPMCSPRGADTPDPGSPLSSPADILQLPEDEEADVRPGVENEDEKELVWSEDVVDPFSLRDLQEYPHLARHPPPSPPSLPVPLSQRDMCGAGTSFSSHLNASLPLSSPNLSPINDNECVMNAAEIRFTSSPGLSPIHTPQSDIDPRNVAYSRTSSVNQISDHRSENETAFMPKSSSVSSQICASHTESAICSSLPSCNVSTISGQQQTFTSVSSSTNIYQRHEQDIRLMYSAEDCPPSSDQHVRISVRDCFNIELVKTDDDDASQYTVMDASAIDKLSSSNNIITTPKNKQTIAEYGKENLASPDILTDGKYADSKQNYLSSTHTPTEDDARQSVTHENCGDAVCHKTPKKTPSSVVDARMSSSSGHFSSSPIREGCGSPPAIDTPNRFSDSPPLSPILYQSMVFQNQQDHQRPPSKYCQDQQLCTSYPALMSVDEVRNPPETAARMEEGRGLTTSGISRLSPIMSCSLPNSTRTALFRSSSVCDMETESQPSLEVSMSGETLSQDTGYHTGSLHTNNYSNITMQDNNITNGNPHLLKVKNENYSLFDNDSKMRSQVDMAQYNSEYGSDHSSLKS